MTATLSSQLLRKPILLFTLIAVFTLLVVAGCISTQKSLKESASNKVITVEKPPEVNGIDSSDLQIIGQKIAHNETGGKPENLIFWSTNESFPSLGIGHFIWFPANHSIGFTESFPSMIRFLKANGAEVPSWLLEQITIGALWDSKQQLEQERDSENVQELQRFLGETSGLQALYLFKRLDSALPKILIDLDEATRQRITERFNTVKASPQGLYPLIDYVNFKGEGTVRSEQHNDVGWGLRQVLEMMEPTPVGNEALKEFALAAELVLRRRIANAPPARNEQRWLPGWRVRLRTYYQ